MGMALSLDGTMALTPTGSCPPTRPPPAAPGSARWAGCTATASTQGDSMGTITALPFPCYIPSGSPPLPQMAICDPSASKGRDPRQAPVAFKWVLVMIAAHVCACLQATLVTVPLLFLEILGRNRRGGGVTIAGGVEMWHRVTWVGGDGLGLDLSSFPNLMTLQQYPAPRLYLEQQQYPAARMYPVPRLYAAPTGSHPAAGRKADTRRGRGAAR